MSKLALRVASRTSALALAQAKLVCEALSLLDSSLSFEVVPIVTTADRRLDMPLHALGGRDQFVQAVESAVSADQADFAVHSCKDVPHAIDPNLTLSISLPREETQDVLVSMQGLRLEDLSAGAKVGTSSPRRRTMLHFERPDLQCIPIRGNVQTRCQKLHTGEVDALVLAAAGLNRLPPLDVNTHVLPTRIGEPAPGQGALAVQFKPENDHLASLFDKLSDTSTRLAVQAERRCAHALGADCHSAVAALAEINLNANGSGTIMLNASVWDVHGRTRLRSQATASFLQHTQADGVAAVATRCADHLLTQGAAAFLSTSL